MSDGPPDKVLAKQAKEGEIGAFESLFNKYKKPILNFIYRLIGNKETAEEVTLEVFMNAYKHLDVYDPDRKFSTWLYTIARNLAKNALRDKKYFRDVSVETVVSDDDKAVRLGEVLADPNARPDIIAQDEELAAEAQKVIDSLPVKYKEVIMLCSIQGLPHKEVASILGCSIANVSILLNKAKELFMKKLGIDSAGREGSGNDEN